LRAGELPAKQMQGKFGPSSGNIRQQHEALKNKVCQL
jgi:hypothetical protein